MLVLVVEDEPLIAIAVEDALERAGHQALGPVATRAEALSAAAAQRPDLAFVNLRLRNGDSGVDVARELRDRWQVPTIFASGQTDEIRRHRDLAIGILCKPYDDAAVIVAVKAAEAVMRGEAVEPNRFGDRFELFGRSV
jgi:DNA-binding response OmpR family regulator